MTSLSKPIIQFHRQFEMYITVMFRLIFFSLMLFEPILAKLMPLKRSNVGALLTEYLSPNLVNMLISDDKSTFKLRNLTYLSSTVGRFERFIKLLKTTPQSFIIANVPIHNIADMFDNSPNVFTGAVQYVVISNETNMVQDIAELLWQHRFPHSLILTHSEDVTTAYILDIQQCGQMVKTEMVNVVTKWSLREQFSGCPIYALWITMPPFVNEINSSKPGIFIEMLDAITFISKRKVIYRDNDPIYLEEIAQSYTFDSVLNDLDGEYAQLFIGPTNTHTATIFDLSPVVTDDSMLFLCPKPLDRYLKTIQSKDMLIRIIGYGLFLYALVVLFYYMAKETLDRDLFPSISKTYLVFYGLMFDIPSLNNKFPKNAHLRIYLG